VTRKLTLLWQDPETGLRDYILELLGPMIDKEVFDGKHQIVLDDCMVVDTQLHLNKEYYRQFRGRNAFLFREPDEYFADASGIYQNFCGVFRMHHSEGFKKTRVMGIMLGYLKGLKADGPVLPASSRPYAWSMMGGMSKSTRPDALTALMKVTPGYWFATDGWRPRPRDAASNKTEGQTALDYRNVLLNSAFCPSPMGNAQQETWRTAEALEAGAIPIVEKQLFMDVYRNLLGKHPIPTFSDWNKAAGFVTSMHADPRALDQLQTECAVWWTGYKSELTSRIQSSVERLWNDPPSSAGEFVYAYTQIPGWPLIELLRHHSLPAVKRRIFRQITRLLKTGKLTERL